jgi:hypothetical protein
MGLVPLPQISWLDQVAVSHAPCDTVSVSTPTFVSPVPLNNTTQVQTAWH